MVNILFLLTPKKDVVFEYRNATMRQLVEKMSFHSYTTIPILNTDGSFFETITEGDLLRKMLQKPGMTTQKMENILVDQIATARVYEALAVTASIEEVLELIKRQNFIPIVDDQGTFIGIITRGSIMEYMKTFLENTNVK